MLNATDRTSAGSRAGHSHGIATVTLRFDEALDFATVSDWLAALVAEHGAALLRVKGIVQLRGQDRPVAVHGVRHVFHPPKLLDRWPDMLAESAIVFILDHLDPEMVWRRAVAAGLAPRRSAHSPPPTLPRRRGRGSRAALYPSLYRKAGEGWEGVG